MYVIAPVPDHPCNYSHCYPPCNYSPCYPPCNYPSCYHPCNHPQPPSDYRNMFQNSSWYYNNHPNM